MLKKTLLLLSLSLPFSLFLPSCTPPSSNPPGQLIPSSVQVAGAMKNVMWKGELGGIISMDTLSGEGLYGIGPLEYLRGELLILDGKTYVSTVLTDSTMLINEKPTARAPFFVYAEVNEWEASPLPDSIRTIPQLETYIDRYTEGRWERPFAFKLAGRVDKADIHIQNLPEGSTVSSPQEAHRGQTNYLLENQEVEIVGFFSKAHQGVFTHHDSFVHLHLITADRQQMGHLDEVQLGKGEMRLFLPKG